MGKKEKSKKKKQGLGKEKTLEKTEKKLKQKLKKATGEEDIESLVKAIEQEERQRQEVKETRLKEPPSARSNLSMTAHPDNPEIVFFGGEFYNGQKTLLYKDLLFYHTKRREWSQVSSPAGPPPRSSHQAVLTAQAGGQLWIFGGEYASPSETQFYHYKDLWCFHFASKRWEKVSAPGGPSSRSGHRMVLLKRHLVVFGGFHDNLRDCKYFNDVYAFNLDARKWKKLETVGAGPSPRSACNMFPLEDGRLVVFGGYCKEKGKKDAEKGVTLTDMFALAPDKHDPTMTKFRWQTLKQVGFHRPTARSGMSVAVAPAPSSKILFFGGVQDVKEDEEELEGKFFNDLYSLAVENERATWSLVELSGPKDPHAAGAEKKRRRRQKGEGEEGGADADADEEDAAPTDKMETLQIKETKQNSSPADAADAAEAADAASSGAGPSTVTVEEGAFTITSTVGLASSSNDPSASASASAESANRKAAFVPSPRFGSMTAVKQGTLYLFGGMVEDGDKQFTLKDMYCLDLHKLDEWQTLIEPDLEEMEWYESDDDDDDDDDSSGDDDSEGMEDND